MLDFFHLATSLLRMEKQCFGTPADKLTDALEEKFGGALGGDSEIAYPYDCEIAYP